MKTYPYKLKLCKKLLLESECHSKDSGVILWCLKEAFKHGLTIGKTKKIPRKFRLAEAEIVARLNKFVVSTCRYWVDKRIPG